MGYPSDAFADDLGAIVVKKVVPLTGYRALVYYRDGAVRLWDYGYLAAKLPFLKDQTSSDKIMTVMDDTLAWDLGGNRDAHRCYDPAFETIYDESQPVDAKDFLDQATRSFDDPANIG